MNINVKLHEDFTAEIVEKCVDYLKKLHKAAQEGGSREEWELAFFGCFIDGLITAHIININQRDSFFDICCDILEDGRKDVPQITDFSITRERIRLVIDG